MADLNLAVIARWIDRMSGPAKASLKTLAGVGQAQAAVAKAQGSAAKAASLATKAAAGLTRATNQQTQAVAAATRATDAQERSMDRVNRRLGLVTNGMGAFERMQRRGAAAGRMFGGEMEKLDKRLGRLAMASIATEGLHRSGHAIAGPLERALEDASKFSGGMTGLGITAELSDAQLAPIRRAILQSAARMALSPETTQETYAFTRRSGVFRSVPEIIAAGSEATRFQKLAERMGSPVTGEQVAGGASSAVREYGFGANPESIRRFFAMIDAAEKTGGGMTMSDLLEYARSSGGQMKALNFGNSAGLADVLAGQQLSMYLAHTGGQAGINFQDLLSQLAQPHTLRRYAKHGVNLERAIKLGEARGLSPVETVAAVTQKMTGGDRFRVGELMINQQATQAMLALMQNMDKFRQYSRQISSAGAESQYNADVTRVINDQRTAVERLAVAQNTLGVATGTVLLPAMTKLAGLAQRVATWFTNAEEKGGPLAKAAVYLASGFAVLAVGAGMLGQAVVGVLGPIWIMQTLFGKALPLALIAARGAVVGFFTSAAEAAMGFAIALAANPITWVVAGVAALAVGGYLLVKNWGAVKAWLGNFWEWLKTTASGAFDRVKSLFAWKPPTWLAQVASIAALAVPGAAPLAAVASAASAAPPAAPPHKVEQHFHVYPDRTMDERKLAEHLHRLGRDGQSRALHDGASE